MYKQTFCSYISVVGSFTFTCVLETKYHNNNHFLNQKRSKNNDLFSLSKSHVSHISPCAESFADDFYRAGLFSSGFSSSCFRFVQTHKLLVFNPIIIMQSTNDDASVFSSRPPTVLDVVLRNQSSQARNFDLGSSPSESSSIVTQCNPTRSKYYSCD